MRRNTQLLLLAVSLSSALSVNNGANDKDNNNSSEQCGLYLALSSTSTGDRTQWGIYAGRDYAPTTTIGQPELAVNAIHLRANNLFHPETRKEQTPMLLRSLEFLEESFWVPDAAGSRFELERGRIISAISGVGFLGAYDSKLTNADWNHAASYQRPRLGEEAGAPHPSRGAISPFYNVELKSTDSIPAGSEIFINYGTNWEDNEFKDELIKPDFAKIDKTVDQLIAFFAKHEKELTDDSKQEIYQFITKDVMTAAVGEIKARKVAALLPPSPDYLHKVKAAGGTLIYSQPTISRSIEWLNEHGRCLDNIRPGASTIPNAGRGAIANRNIKKGALVAPSPLLHIPDQAVLDMHDVYVTETGDYVRESDEVKGQQLLVNYCFGHKDSTMLFYPVGSGVGLINHSEKPNAKVVWSTHPSHQKYWYNLEPNMLLAPDNVYLGLMIEVVALTDIKEGEEIFIDYGDEWKAAWEKHVTEWNKGIDEGEIPKQWPLKALDLNEEYRTKVYKTEEELAKDPYPPNVGLGAFLMLEETKAAGTPEDPAIWTIPPNGTFFFAENLFEPVVLSRVKIEAAPGVTMPYNYTVKWTNSKGEHTFVKNVPHSAFAFVDEPEMSDHFVVNAFRHPIGIPDEIFPQGPWRNAAAP